MRAYHFFGIIDTVSVHKRLEVAAKTFVNYPGKVGSIRAGNCLCLYKQLKEIQLHSCTQRMGTHKGTVLIL